MTSKRVQGVNSVDCTPLIKLLRFIINYAPRARDSISIGQY